LRLFRRLGRIRVCNPGRRVHLSPEHRKRFFGAHSDGVGDGGGEEDGIAERHDDRALNAAVSGMSRLTSEVELLKMSFSAERSMILGLAPSASAIFCAALGFFDGDLPILESDWEIW